MSKVFKSTYVQIGTPKPLENIFIMPEKPKIEPEEAFIATEEKEEADNEELANHIIDEAKQMYLKIIEEANFEARKIVDKAREEAEEIKEIESQRGYEAGFLEGKSQAQQIVDEAAGIREFIDNRKQVIYKEIEEELVCLVLEAVKKIIGDELNSNQDIIFSLIGEALKKCTFTNKLTIRVSQEDYDHVVRGKDRISSLVEGISELEIHADLSLEKGGCILETPSGEINSSIGIQLEGLEKAFNYVLGNE